MWMYVTPFESGIRLLDNNRHMFGHTTVPSDPYRNVFSVHRGPLSFKTEEECRIPTWKIWLSDAIGNEKSWPHQDSTAIPEGWRHFVTRRDHKQPRLELLIDGRAVIAIDDHTRFRPSEPAEAITVGSWPNLSKVHFVNTSVWRLQVLQGFPGDPWIRRERIRREIEQRPPLS
jgi:hypothetical protein